MEQATHFYLINVDALIFDLCGRSTRTFTIEPLVDQSQRAHWVHPKLLIARLPHFVRYGVTLLEDNQLVMVDARGDMLDSSATLDHLFGTVGGLPASRVLFAKADEGAFDHVLLKRVRARHNQLNLFMERLLLARDVWTGESLFNGLGPRTSKFIALLQEPVAV